MATGLRDELPEVSGLRERWGVDVLHCPYCHGYEVRDMPLAVLGGDNRPFTIHQASLVRQWSSDVVFFPNRITLAVEERTRLTARGIRIAEGEIAGLVVQDHQLHGIELADGQIVPRAVAFVGPPAQLINAAGAGTKAGIALNHFLLERDVQQAVAAIPTACR
ncbi:NAD(P)/FAD-dependent oxidoreductase [Nocardia sp. FBN12]|uniref:NAD(P)/FAD-dependent oxidoreductase n=1 Tax=Nocardia sp. FBN12 TaxID=3419766 RepID=UPI003CFD1C31